MPTPIDATIVLELLKKAHEQGFLDKLLDAFKKKHQILVLGSSGAGKTQFIRSLTQALPEVIDHTTRTAFASDIGSRSIRSPSSSWTPQGRSGTRAVGARRSSAH